MAAILARKFKRPKYETPDIAQNDAKVHKIYLRKMLQTELEANGC